MADNQENDASWIALSRQALERTREIMRHSEKVLSDAQSVPHSDDLDAQIGDQVTPDEETTLRNG